MPADIHIERTRYYFVAICIMDHDAKFNRISVGSIERSDNIELVADDREARGWRVAAIFEHLNDAAMVPVSPADRQRT